MTKIKLAHYRKTRMSERKKPVHVARAGNVRVSVYRYGDGRFGLAWRPFASASRKVEVFKTRAEAVTRADEIASAIANSQADVVTLTSAARDSYRLAVQKLSPFGIQLHAAIEEFIAARNLAPAGLSLPSIVFEYVSTVAGIRPHSLAEASSFFIKNVVAKTKCPPTAQILSELITELSSYRREARKYVDPLKRDLEPFAASYPDLSATTKEDILKHLGALVLNRKRHGREIGDPVGARRRDNVRDAIVRLFRFAKEKEYLPRDSVTPAERVPRLSEGGEVTTYSVEQLESILTHFATSDRDWLPWAALGAFGGLRTSEILRLEWSAFRWGEGVIAVRRSVARKVRTARQVPILDALLAWLPERKTDGFVIPRKWKNLESAQFHALGRLRAALGWSAWANNALRHSFGSHRLAIVKSYAQVALEMGNSPAKVRENYNDPKSDIESKRYFSLFPAESVKNIIPMATGK